VDSTIDGSWPVEDIPEDATLYMRVHQNHLDSSGRPAPIAFKNRPEHDPHAAMSTNWDRYAPDPEYTRKKDANKPANEYAVIAMKVFDVLQIERQMVKHAPLRNNRAHTEVHGEKTKNAKLGFIDISTVVLPVPGEGIVD